jgi:hypothetical protein
MSSPASVGSRVTGDVLMVGSLPYPDAETAFRAAAAGLGDRVSCLTDGEPAERQLWVWYLPQFIYSNHPDLIETHHPADPTSQPTEEQGVQRGASEAFWWHFKVKDGVEELRFDLGYGRFAIESYAVFTRLRNDGVIPAGVKFQVALPTATSAVDPFAPDQRDRELMEAAYRDAIDRNIQEMLDHIPVEELVIQYDAAWEICDVAIGDENYYPFWPQRTTAEKIDHHLGLLRGLAAVVPPDVALGYHWCYGTAGGWPMVAMEDLSLCVDLANRAVAEAPRKVDYIHMPVAETADDAFYAPLADLNVGDTRIFLGLVHFHEEDTETFEARVATAHRYLPDFGIAAVCGYGREDPEKAGDIFALHRACADLLS